MRIMKRLSTLFFTILAVMNVSAQKKKVVQVALIYPVGTAVTNSLDYTNNFSLNIIGGLNGGVKGFKLGAIFSL